MSVFALALFAAVIGFGAMVPEAEAKRLGGGKSSGFSRDSSVMKREAVPPKAASPAAAAAPAAVAANKSGMSRWLGPLAGLAAGGLGINLRRGPAAVEHGGVVARIGSGATAPGAGGGRLLHQVGVVLQLVEEGAPFPRHRAGVRGPFFVQVLNEGGVRAIEEAGLGKDLVQLTCIVRHVSLVVLHSGRARTPAR